MIIKLISAKLILKLCLAWLSLAKRMFISLNLRSQIQYLLPPTVGWSEDILPVLGGVVPRGVILHDGDVLAGGA